MGRPSRYPEEFRREAVALALSSDESRAAVARRLGVNETTLRNWVAAQLAEEARQADPLAVTGSEFEELRRLRRGERGVAHRAGDPAQGSRLFRPGDDPVCRFRFVAEHRDVYGVKRLCRVLGVSRSGFYAWRTRQPSPRSVNDAELVEMIVEIHDRSRCTYGAPRVHAELARLGRHCGRKRVARLMRTAGLVGVHARRRWRNGRPELAPAPDLVNRDFDSVGTGSGVGRGRHPVPHPRRLAASRRGVIDLWSRRVVGWSMSNTPNSRARHRCAGHGVRTTSTRSPGRASLRPWRRLHVARVLPTCRGTRARPVVRFHRRLLRQRRRRSVLGHPQTRTRLDPQHHSLGNPRRVAFRALRLHRRLLQPEPNPTSTWPPQPRRLRRTLQPLENPCPRKRVNSRRTIERSVRRYVRGRCARSVDLALPRLADPAVRLDDRSPVTSAPRPSFGARFGVVLCSDVTGAPSVRSPARPARPARSLASSTGTRSGAGTA